MLRSFRIASLATFALALGASISSIPVFADFLQEDRVRTAALSALEGSRVSGLGVDADGRVVAGTNRGLFREEAGEWRRLSEEPFSRVRAGLDGQLYAASKATLLRIDRSSPPRRVLVHELGAIADFAVDRDGRAVVVGPVSEQDSVTWELNGHFQPRDNVALYRAGGERLRAELPEPHVFAWSTTCDETGRFWIAAKQGLYSWDGKAFQRPAPPGEELWMLGEQMDGLHAARDGSIWFANDLGVTRHEPRTGAWTGMRTDTHGVPFPYARAIAEAADGSIWIGGEHGAARREAQDRLDAAGRQDLAGRWAYFQGEAWLPDDSVLSIAIGPDNRVFLGTEKGLAVISRTPMTLDRKAAHFEAVAVQHNRNRYGFVWSVDVKVAGDASTANESGYTDNDGLWTAQYIGAECFRFAATRSEDARKNAKRSMDALLELERVTGIPGYPARSYAVVANHPGDTRFDAWHKTSDGKYFWKGDTSSDEAVGHYFAHALYYDHVADETEKPMLKKLIAQMTDHILDHGYAYVEREDGEPTRWGIWSPERCWKWGHYWYSSRLWALCILSHLKVAHHVTGDAKYDREYRRLIAEHDYARKTIGQKVTIGHINHSDDQMAILSYYPLLCYEEDPALRSTYLESLRQSWEIERPESSPLWNFIQNWAFANRTDLDRSIDHLIHVPWMLFTWNHDNSRRWDLPMKPLLRGRAESARALNMAEQGPYGFTNNPYTLRSGDGGRTLESPSLYLLPYWLGRHHGLIAPGD